MLFQSKERKANKELLDLYKCWYNEISNIAPSLLGDKYSNPWYCAVPDKWFGDSERILIVGEDGFGFAGNGKADGIRPDEIKKLQERSLDFFKHYIANTSDGEHPFWMRARLVAFRGVPVAYTFLNKFSMKRDHRSKPSDSDRVLMHSTSMKLLAEEISILKPTVVYFFGWYGDVIKMELPTVHKKLYPGGDSDSSMWKDSFASIEDGGIQYIFSYNPYSPYWKNKPNDYEQQLIDELHKYITFTRAKQQKAIAKYSKYEEKGSKTQSVENNVEPGVVQQTSRTVAPSQSSRSTTPSEVLNNPVVGAAASYVLGKTATSSIKNTRTMQNLAKNPNTEKYKKAQDGANANRGSLRNKYVAKIGASSKVCATCEYWDGGRCTDAVNHGRIANVQTETGTCTCKQSQKKNKKCKHNETCGKWNKWSGMK